MELIKEGRYQYIETSPEKPVLLLLHGLFGALSNFTVLIDAFTKEYNVVVPILPIYELDLDKTGLEGLLNFTKEFVDYKDFEKVHVLGNSLGGHIAQLYTLECPNRVASMILTGSSGLFESGMGDGYPRRGDKEYIANKTAETFYDNAIATPELIDEVFDAVNDRNKAIRIVITAKTAIKHNTGDQLGKITCPTLLIWGLQDTITPPFVGDKFKELIPHAELKFVDKCGHAPMMEVPDEFNLILASFLRRL